MKAKKRRQDRLPRKTAEVCSIALWNMRLKSVDSVARMMDIVRMTIT
jgi:hypothetical protein